MPRGRRANQCLCVTVGWGVAFAFGLADGVGVGGVTPAGQVIGRMTEVRPVAAVMADLVKETNQALDRLAGLR